MAVWQFKFTLIPISGIIRLHGAMIDVLPEFAARAPDAPFDEDIDYSNYWEGIDMTPMRAMARSILPDAESWSDEATMYGDSTTDDIQIWDDSVDVRLNCGNLNLSLLNAVVAAARASNCCLALSEGGRTMSPEPQLLVSAIHASAAYKFVQNPRAFLESIHRTFNSGPRTPE